MADKIKAFFEKRKGKGKFKGKGHKLTDSSAPPVGQVKNEKPVVRQAPTDEAKQAGLAALARFDKKIPSSSFGNALSLKSSTKTTVSTNFQKGDPPVKVEKVNTNPDILAVQGVYFRCPLISPAVLPKDEWKEQIKNFLYEQVELEKGLTSCLMIHTLNKNRDEVSQCVETLCTYLTNIISNPADEKYKKIRLSNKIFQEKVANIEGSLQFLEAAGFEKRRLPFKDDEEDFLVFASEVDDDHLEMLIDSLRSAEAVPMELDRNVQVMIPEVASKRMDLPDEFYRMTVDELKKEMQNKTERMETLMQLRTKAMREKEEQRELRKYRYTLIRIRFPNGVFLQGTFNVYEKSKAVKEFVQEHLSSDGSFTLKNALGQELTSDEDDSTLLELKLVPAVLLTFVWSSPDAPAQFLSEETLKLLQSV